MKSIKAGVKLAMPPVLIGAIVVGAVLSLGIALKRASSSPIESMVASTEKAKKVYAGMMNGCVFRALEDERLIQILMLTQGQVCNNILGDSVSKETEGKGFCSNNDEKCLFKIGYAKTAAVTTSKSFSSQELQALEEQAEIAYSKFLEQKPQ